jgi:hypothetical protein
MTHPSTANAPRKNLLPNVWGKHAWMFLYTVALGYPNNPTQEEKTSAKNLLISLQHLLPCDKCRVNFRTKMNGEFGMRLDQAVQNSETFTHYIYDLESAVASTTGKVMPSYADTQAKLMSNTYVVASQLEGGGGGGGKQSGGGGGVMLAIILPIAAIAIVIITWGLTYTILNKKK